MTGYRAYRGQQVQTSSPLELILLAYEVLICSLHRTMEAQKQQDFVAESLHAQQAIAAVTELMNGLDYDNGGDIAADLGSLYLYTTQQIITAQGSNDPQKYQELIDLINVLRSGWMELRDRQRTTPNTTYTQEEAPQQPRIALAA
ncbi:MAG: flagellar export chaperone FliS [Mariprofundales bacterium]|nr:flagellar export chaperone FliS [Mariprofundales bacterium]